MSKSKNYQDAFDELQEIVARLESGEVSVDELSAQVKRATELLAICRSKLKSTEDDVAQVIKKLDSSN